MFKEWRGTVREGVRFWRGHRLLSGSAVVILSLGMGLSSLALNALWALSHPRLGGVRPGIYVTVAEKAQGGPLAAISWRRVKEVEADLPDGTVGAYASPITATANGGQGAFPLGVAALSSNFFEKFGAALAAGTGFSAGAEGTTALREVIVSFEISRHLFGGPAGAIGRYIRVNGTPLQIVGVAGPQFEGLFEQRADAWIPPGLIVPIYFDFTLKVRGDVSGRVPAFYALVATHGRSSESAAQFIGRRLTAGQRRGPKLAATPEIGYNPAQKALLKAWAGLALIVAIFLSTASGLSFGGLLLARAPRQIREVQLKRALGAGSKRLCLDLAAGPAMVTALGLLGGFGVASAAAEIAGKYSNGTHAALSLSRPDIVIPMLAQVPLAVFIAIAMGLVPALWLLRANGAPSPAYTGTGSRQSVRLLEVVIAAQIVCCICVSILAAMVGRSAVILGREALGYEPENRNVLTITMKSTGQFATDSRGGSPLARALNSVLTRVEQFPRVEGAAIAAAAPLEMSAKSMMLGEAAEKERSVAFNAVTPGYFKALGTPLVAGRDFSGGLLAGDPDDAIVNQTLQNQIWPQGSAVGKTIRLENPELELRFEVTIRGVAADQRMAGPNEPARPTVYLPLSGSVFAGNLPLYLIVKGSEPLFRLQAAADDELSSAFPNLGIVRSYRIEDRLLGVKQAALRRVLFALGGAAAIAAIAYVGLYSSLIYFIASNRRELAIRICCGATSSAIFGMVLGRALRVGGGAACISIVCWPALRRILADGWIGAAAWSWIAAATVTTACLSAVAAIAVIPAMRAARMMPVEAIREQA